MTLIPLAGSGCKIYFFCSCGMPLPWCSCSFQTSCSMSGFIHLFFALFRSETTWTRNWAAPGVKLLNLSGCCQKWYVRIYFTFLLSRFAFLFFIWCAMVITFSAIMLLCLSVSVRYLLFKGFILTPLLGSIYALFFDFVFLSRGVLLGIIKGLWHFCDRKLCEKGALLGEMIGWFGSSNSGCCMIVILVCTIDATLF